MSAKGELSELVSIVVPVYNRAHLVERTLDSIYAQTYRPINLIIVDNNSKDNSLEVVSKWKDSHESDDFQIKIYSEAIPGAAVARQKGLDHVETDKVLFFDSDDVMLPTLLKKAMTECDNHPDINIVTWPVTIIYPSGKKNFKKTVGKNMIRDHFVSSVFRTQGYMAKTNFIRKIGGWNKDMMVWDDYELGVRICLNNPQIKTISSTLVNMYHHSDSITGDNFFSKIGEWENVLDYCKEDIKASNHPQKNEMLRWIIYRKVILAADYYKEGHPTASLNLLRETLKKQELSLTDRILLKFIYHFTKLGGRGAYYFWH